MILLDYKVKLCIFAEKTTNTKGQGWLICIVSALGPKIAQQNP